MIALLAEITPADVYARQQVTQDLIRDIELMMYVKLAIHLIVLAACVYLIIKFNRFRTYQDGILLDQAKTTRATLEVASQRSALDSKTHKQVLGIAEETKHIAEVAQATVEEIKQVIIPPGTPPPSSTYQKVNEAPSRD